MKHSLAQQEGAGAEDTQIDENAALGEMERDVAAKKVGGRTKLGRKSDYNKKRNTPEGKKLKQEYAKVGGDRAAQTQFKLAWWNKKIKEGKAKTELQEVEEVKEEFNGMYKPLGKIIFDQGNDAPALMKGFNIAKSCIKLRKRGSSSRAKTT